LGGVSSDGSAFFVALHTLSIGDSSTMEANSKRREIIMPTETEPTTAISQKTDEGDQSSQRTGLTQQTRPGAIARILRPSVLGLPLSPFEMFRMSPFSLFRRMADEFDRVLQPLASEGEFNQAIAWTPTVEISERDGKFNILAELPGLSPNEVRVEVVDDALVIQGERKFERESTEGGVRRSERQFGLFYRRVPLPEGANPDEAKARFHDGVLEISMPAPKPQSNRRPIQIESDSKSSSTETKSAANDTKAA
jgi:HSP20 family protein